jgi:hypothetical protein
MPEDGDHSFSGACFAIFSLFAVFDTSSMESVSDTSYLAIISLQSDSQKKRVVPQYPILGTSPVHMLDSHERGERGIIVLFTTHLLLKQGRTDILAPEKEWSPTWRSRKPMSRYFAQTSYLTATGPSSFPRCYQRGGIG